MKKSPKIDLDLSAAKISYQDDCNFVSAKSCEEAKKLIKELDKIRNAPNATPSDIFLVASIVKDISNSLGGTKPDNSVWEKHAESLRKSGVKAYKALSALLCVVAVLAGIAALLAFSPTLLAFAPAALSSAAASVPTGVVAGSSAAAVATVSGLVGIGLWATQRNMHFETAASTELHNFAATLTATS